MTRTYAGARGAISTLLRTLLRLGRGRRDGDRYDPTSDAYRRWF